MTQYRIRLWINQDLADERWVSNEDQLEQLRIKHERMIEEAAAKGAVFMVELWDPEAPADNSCLRFGTDPTMMRNPQRTIGVEDTLQQMRDAAFFAR